MSGYDDYDFLYGRVSKPRTPTTTTPYVDAVNRQPAASPSAVDQVISSVSPDAQAGYGAGYDPNFTSQPAVVNPSYVDQQNRPKDTTPKIDPRYQDASSPNARVGLGDTKVTQALTDNAFKKANTELTQFINEGDKIIEAGGAGYDWSQYEGGYEQFKQDVAQARSDLKTNQNNLTLFHYQTDPKSERAKEADSRVLTPDQQRKVDEADYAVWWGQAQAEEQEAAARRLKGEGVIGDTTILGTVSRGNRSSIGSTTGQAGYILKGDTSTLTARQKADLAILGFKPTTKPKGGALSQEDARIFLGVGVVGHETDILANPDSGYNRVVSATRKYGVAMVNRAREEKLKGNNLAAGALFAAGGAVGGVAGITIGGDIEADIKENPLSAAIQIGVLTLTIADLTYEGAQAINRRFGITNKAYLARLPDSAFEIDAASGRLGSVPTETYDIGLELGDFEKYADDLAKQFYSPTQTKGVPPYQYTLEYRGKTPTLFEAELPKADLKGKSSTWRFKNGNLYPDLDGLTPHGDYTLISSVDNDPVATLWGKKKTYQTVDYTDILKRDTEAKIPWLDDFNAQYEAKLRGNKLANSMSGATNPAPKLTTGEGGSILGSGKTSGGTVLKTESTGVGSYPISNRGQLPNPYYATDTGLSWGVEVSDSTALSNALKRSTATLPSLMPKTTRRLTPITTSRVTSLTRSTDKSKDSTAIIPSTLFKTTPIVISKTTPDLVTKTATIEDTILKPRPITDTVTIPKPKTPPPTTIRPPQPKIRKMPKLNQDKPLIKRKKGKGTKRSETVDVRLHAVQSAERIRKKVLKI